MKLIEKIKLQHRANKYKNKDDVGGIAYVLQSIESGQTVLDIGAHKGGYLYFMQQLVGNTGKVFAFEPQSTLFHYLTNVKKIFNWNNVTVEHIAISDAAGKVTLFIPSNKKRASSPGATLVESTLKNNISTKEEIETKTLDSYCAEKNIQPHLLKIDVEGNELRVFKGATEVLKKYKPKIIVECEERHVGKEQVMETIKFLENLGYKGSFIYGTERLPIHELDFAVHQNTANKLYANNFVFE